MKTPRLLGIILAGLAFTWLTSCSNNNFLYQSQVNQNLVHESWMQRVNTNPNVWTRGADRWFFTGEPNQTERYANYAPAESSMTISAVRVPQFTNINLQGNLQVQIVGLQEQNSVYILGTNDAVGQTSVKVRGDTIYVTQNPNGRASAADLRNVIVRIGVHNLRNLYVAGATKVEGRNVMSDNLCITSVNCRSILLNGDMNLTQVNQNGSGSVSVIGAYSPNLNLYVNGPGTVNVSGRVNVHNINHAGNGVINVIGAESSALNIHASGNGLTAIAGYANLKKLTARDGTQVFLYWVNSNGAYISEQDHAIVGLAGCATNINIDAAGSSRLYGQYLHGINVYVRTRGFAHVNIAADQKIFAAAGDNSSIYFFGSPNNVSRFMQGSGTVLPMWSDSASFPSQRPMQYKSMSTTPTWTAKTYGYSVQGR